LKKFYRKAMELFFIVTDMGIEARRALTRCQNSGHGCPRKLAEGSLRRNGQEGRDEVGDSHVLPPELKKFYRKAVGLFFIVTGMGTEARRALTRCQKSGHGCPHQRAEGSLRSEKNRGQFSTF
jgi:hypothetical protein